MELTCLLHIYFLISLILFLLVPAFSPIPSSPSPPLRLFRHVQVTQKRERKKNHVTLFTQSKQEQWPWRTWQNNAWDFINAIMSAIKCLKTWHKCYWKSRNLRYYTTQFVMLIDFWKIIYILYLQKIYILTDVIDCYYNYFPFLKTFAFVAIFRRKYYCVCH